MLYRQPAKRRGIAATEMAIVAPLLLILISGLWEVGRYVAVQNLLDNAAREGGRLSSSCAYFSSNDFTDATGATITLAPPSTNSACEVQQKVLLYLQRAGITTTGATVTVTNTTQNWSYKYTQGGTITGSGYDPTADASQLDQLLVSVTLPYSNVSWSPLNIFISKTATLTATVNWSALTDVPLDVSTAIPTKPLQPTDPLP